MDFLDSDSSDEETTFDDHVGKNGLMCLVDFRENMFEIDTNINKTYFRSSLDIYKNLLIDIAKSGKKDLVGLSLIGTERGTSDISPLIANIQPLDTVSANRIKEIDNIIVDNCTMLKDKYGRVSKNGFNLIKILNGSIKLFLDNKKKVYARNLVIITSDDDPFGPDIKAAHLARKQAKKLSYAGIDLTVVGCKSGFDSNKFYNELVALARGEFTKDWAKVNRVKTLDELDHHLISCMSRLSRTMRSLHFGNNIGLPICLYKLFKEPKIKFRKEAVKRQDEDIVSDEEGMSTLMPSARANSNTTQTATAKSTIKDNLVPLVGGKLINITKAELEKANFEVEVGLTLIGFVPTRDIPEYLTIKPPRVILPNYFSKEGTEFFTYMLQHCQEKKLSMLGWYKYNVKSLISLVCCHPMPEQSDSKGNVCPAGFCMVTLPFSDNYSDPEFNSLEIDESEKQLEAARNIVKKLSVGYRPDNFHDYEIQRTLAMIEALALDYDHVVEIDDDTIVDEKAIDERIADYIDDFMDCKHVGEFDSVAANKRPAEPSYRATKNPKLTSLDGIMDTIRNGKAQILTVAQLKEALDAKGISYAASSKKPQLIQMASAHIK